MQRHVVAQAEQLPPGSSLIVELGGRSIGVFNHEGSLHALRNSCPHHGAPLCRGVITGMVAVKSMVCRGRPAVERRRILPSDT